MLAMSASFVPSLELNADFYREVVAPLVAPFPHAAALLGWGSDVLGYDTARSTDHGWGPRLQVFVAADAVEPARAAVDAGLPEAFGGYPVRFGWDAVEEQHRVDVLTLQDWLTGQLGFDPRAGMDTFDWLTVSQQQLLGVVGGAVYADPDGALAAVRESVAWYPHDVWLWLLGCQWQRVSQEEPFVGRTAEVGDEIGSRLLAGRQARELMGLAFLLARTYWPYTKWFGTAFSRLPGTDHLGSALEHAVAATTFEAREDALVEAYETVARMHNRAGITVEIDPTVRDFHGRPFRVLMSERFATACVEKISDPALRDLPLVGSVDQLADSTDVLSSPERTRYLRSFYQSL